MNHFSRKVYRSLVKQLLRFADIPHVSEKAHEYEGLWLNPEPDLFSDTFDIFFKHKPLGRSRSLRSLESEKGMEDIYLVGAGPSIKELDLGRLEGKKIVYMNGSITLTQKVSTPPFFIVIIDSTFCVKRPEILDMIPRGSNLLLSFQALKEMAYYNPRLVEENNIFLSQHKSNTQFLYRTDPEEALQIFDRYEFGRMSAGTVMAEAIRLAAYFKAQKTFLLGLDIGNANKEPRFYERRSNRVRTSLLEDYEKKILPFMKIAARYFQEQNREIFNCSPITKLPYDIIPYNASLEKSPSAPVSSADTATEIHPTPKPQFYDVAAGRRAQSLGVVSMASNTGTAVE